MKTHNSLRFLLSAFAMIAFLGDLVHAGTLIGDAFVSANSNWTDAFPAPTRAGNWRLNLHAPTLIDTNNANPPTSGAATNGGTYEPDVLVKANFMAPNTYDLNVTARTNDDDLIGVVWNYSDPNNYFRVGLRQQPASGNFGGTQGLSVQKVVGGVVTQLFPVGNVAGPDATTQAMIDNRTPFNVRVAVNGSSYEVFFNNASFTSGSDPDLASGRTVGFQSWAQQTDAAAVTPFWGSEFESISVSQGGNTLFSESFAARTTPFRQLVMTNAAGVSTLTTASKDDFGNFGQDINDPWILQHSNGFENATVNNTDFIGPAVVVDQAGSANFSDYEMKVRMGATDNDGIGVLVRAADDNNFYRISVTNEAIGAGVTRAPRGLSVQKVRNGVWTELFRDNQDAPQFVYTVGAAGSTPATAGFPAFDLSVKAIGNTLRVQVTDHMGNVINYAPIIDSNDPLLKGTVGFATWGTENVYYANYGGTSGPLLTLIPEPASLAMAIFAWLGGLAAIRRGRTRT